MLRGAAGVVVVAALTAGVFAQTPAQTPAQQGRPQPPIFRAGVSSVRVDAVVSTRAGAPVTDLTAEDFEVEEDGKRQEITTFSLMMLDGGLLPGLEGAPSGISSDAVQENEAAREDVRLFCIFLDDYHVSPTSSRIVRDQLSRFVETQLGPTDMVGVMFPLTLTASIRFTRDHKSVVRILQQFEGRRGDYRPKNAIEEGYVYKMGMGPGIEEIRNGVVFTALQALTMYMGSIKQGRQSVIFVSEGFVGGRDKLYGNLYDLTQTASRYNTAIYPVNPVVLAPGVQWMPGSALDTLNYMAVHTGGRTLVDQTKTGAEYRKRFEVFELPVSQLALSMKQVMIDASVYYLLGYNSTTVPDEKFHKIGVRVKRRNLELRHREGYWARKS